MNISTRNLRTSAGSLAQSNTIVSSDGLLMVTVPPPAYFTTAFPSATDFSMGW